MIGRASHRFALKLLPGALLLACWGGTAQAANLTVNSLADTVIAGNGLCTLREAILNANSDSDTTGGDCVAGSGADTITFSLSGTITLGSTLPNITDADGLTINGTGQSVTVSGNNAVRVMAVNPGAVLHLESLTVAGGRASSGGGIQNRGTLTVNNSTFSGNIATPFDGGGIETLFDSGGTITVTNSTFSANSARFGGGIHNGDDGTLTVSNSTFSGNTATSGGGGINNDHTLSVTNSTFSGNSAGGLPTWGGGGIRSESSSTTHLRNTLVANSTAGGDCRIDGSFPTNIRNLIEDGSCSAALSGDPNLGPLADNGGPTQTFALLASPTPSPAIGAGDDATCAAAPVNNLDQRGVTRPQPQGTHCDIGAFELVEAVIATCPTTFAFDFSDAQYTDCFRDVHLGGQINAGEDIGPTDHPSLVFTGQTGSAGATWLTVYDATPSTLTPGPTFGAETLCADVLFTRFNNIKGAGVVALLNEGAGKSGLALIVSDAGNTDLLRLATVDGDPTKKGKLKILSDCTGSSTGSCSVPLKNGIAENVWYRLIMTVDPTTPRVTGQVWTHSMPLDPDSALGVQVGSTLTYEPAALPTEVGSEGQNGIMAQAISAVVDLSVTNFSNDKEFCEQRRPE